MSVRRLFAAAIVAAGAALALAAVASAATGASGQASQQSKLALEGKHLYGQYCLSCHGGNGAGSQPSSPPLIGAGPLRNQEQQRAVAPSLRGVGALAADFYLRMGFMPLMHVGLEPRRGPVLFSDLQIRALVAYIASLAPGPPIPTPQPELGNISQGQSLFTDHCAGCHQMAARGGYVTGAVAPPLVNVNATQIAEAVRIGPYVMPTFSRQAISNRQLDSIIRYVQYAQHPRHPGGWSIGYIGPVPEGLVAWFFGAAVLVALCIVIGRRLRA